MDHTVQDAELLRRIAKRDQDAMRVLFARHQLRVKRFVARIIGNEAHADDVTNEVFLGAWRNAGSFDGRAAVSTWLLAIAHKKSVSFLRKRRDASLNDEMAHAIPDMADTPETVAAKAGKGAQIRTCMDGLTVDHRQIIDLVYYHEKSIPEIAVILGIPSGTVKTRMFHARRKLGERLREAGVDRGWP